MTIVVTMARYIRHGSREECTSWRPEQSSRAARERSRHPSSRQSASNSWMRVAESGEDIIITKNGKAVAKLTAHREKPKSLYGLGRGRMKIIGDIISPIDVEWEAMVNPDRVINPT